MPKYFLTITLLTLTTISHSANNLSDILEYDALKTLHHAEIVATTNNVDKIKELYEQDCPTYLQKIADDWNKLSIWERIKSYYNGSSYAHHYRNGYFWYTRIMYITYSDEYLKKPAEQRNFRDILTEIALDTEPDTETNFLDSITDNISLFKILRHQRKLPQEKKCA